MTQEEGNKLIAEFMKNNAINSQHLKKVEDMDYHESWDSLIPVVKKCEQLLHEVTKTNNHSDYHVIYSCINRGLYTMDMQYLHNAVVKFIEYNNARIPSWG